MTAAPRPSSLPSTHASSSAASQLPPAFPARAPWGTAGKLRAWQAEAIEHYRTANPRDFLAVATPGAGKTTFALRIATELLEAKLVRRVTVVAPTEHLKRQWADAAARVGITLDPNFSNAQGRHGHGLRRRRGDLRAGGQQARAARRPDRRRAHPGDPRRGAPRR